MFAVIVLVVGIRGLPLSTPSRSQDAARWHENNPLEAPTRRCSAVVVAFLLYLTFSAEHQVDTVSARERPSLTVDVTGAEVGVAVRYFRRTGFGARSGTVGRQPLVVPTDEAIRFNLASVDVIHSFWIPALRYKRDLIPGLPPSQ